MIVSHSSCSYHSSYNGHLVTCESLRGLSEFTLNPKTITRIQRRNPDNCSVFRSELIAIDKGFGSHTSLPNVEEIWILSDSRNAIQHLSSWQRIHLQWIPSHVDLEGKEIADTLAKAGACKAPKPSTSLTFLENFSKIKLQNKTAWIILSEHHWYQCSRPRGSLAHGFNRQEQTVIVRFRRGHLKSMKFSEGSKSFDMCINCSEPALPAHNLVGLGLTKQGLADDSLLVLDLLRVYEAMDLV
ncbi:RNase H domain-containing protein [Trichonephila clavipes]|nr:RNase H domain-containing protein [Trichonephila clavipes]